MNEYGMAAGIFGAMALIVVVGLIAGLFLGRTLARSFGWSGAKRNIAAVIFAALGCGVGSLGVIATFYESSWDPPPQITFVVPKDFSPNWVIVLQDAAATKWIDWRGSDFLPFSGKSAEIEVPPDGIMRVQNLEIISGRVDNIVIWSDGARCTAQGGGPAPKSTGAMQYTAFNRVVGNESSGEEPPFGDQEALGKYILLNDRDE